MLFRLLPILILSTVTTYSQSDTLKRNMDDFHYKNNIQLGVIDGYRLNTFKALSQFEFQEFTPGIMYSRNLDFLHRSIWIKGSFYINNYNDIRGNFKMNNKYHLVSLGINYRFSLFSKQNLHLSIGLEYASDYQYLKAKYIDNSTTLEEEYRNSVILDFNFEIGRLFTFNVSHDFGYGMAKNSFEYYDNSGSLIDKREGRGMTGVVMKGLVFSLGYKF